MSLRKTEAVAVVREDKGAVVVVREEDAAVAAEEEELSVSIKNNQRQKTVSLAKG